MSQGRRLTILCSLLLVGLGLRVYLGWTYPTIYWPDEVIQTLEQAHRWIFGYGEMPWEYQRGLRSWLFPGFLAGVIWVTEPFGPGALGYLFGVTVVLSVVSMIPVVVTYFWARRNSRPVVALTAMVVPVVWMELIYFAPKAFFEVFTAHLLIGAIFLVRFADGTYWRPLLGGVIVGLCCMMRIQLVPAMVVIGVAIPLVASYRHHRFSAYVVGVVMGCALGGFVDAIVWGAPFHSVVTNYYVNLIQGEASKWGTSPPVQYVYWLWEVSPAATILMTVCLGVGAYTHPMLSWSALALFLGHSFIGHKEYRFIYPVIVLGAVAIGLLGARGAEWIDDWWDDTFGVPVAKGAFVLMTAAIAVHAGINFDLRTRGGKSDPNNWHLNRGKVIAVRQISTRDDVCGLVLHGFGSYLSGGYAYLHHDVPIQRFGTRTPLAEQLRERGSGLNIVVSTAWTPSDPMPDGFQLKECILNSKTCVLARTGEC